MILQVRLNVKYDACEITISSSAEQDIDFGVSGVSTLQLTAPCNPPSCSSIDTITVSGIVDSLIENTESFNVSVGDIVSDTDVSSGIESVSRAFNIEDLDRE